MSIKSSKLLGHLVSDFNVSVRDPLWGDIQMTPAIQALSRHPLVYKLSGIRQLGPASILYPGAVHTRLGHSLGVYNIGRKLIISLAGKGCPFLTETGTSSFLVASLLHDLGHFPYAHSLKDLLSQSHEKLATVIISSDSELRKKIEETGADPDAVCSVICPSYTRGTSIEKKELEFYQHLLSGTLDPDKLDYLCRDAYYCGVPYGVQDVSYITDHIECNKTDIFFSGDTGSIEHLLFSKYMMYRDVYWHKTVRSATAMIRKAVTCALKDGIISEDNLYFLDDASFYRMCAKSNYEPFRLADMVFSGTVYRSFVQADCPEEDLPDREELESEVHKNFPDLKPWEIIADIPEPISFETDINIPGTSGEFEKFRAQAIVPQSFATSLRKIRIFHR